MRSTRILLAKIAATPTSFSRWLTRALPLALAVAAVAASPGTTGNATAALPPGNTVAQWNKIAEDTVVGSGAFQTEGFIYMAYASAAVYDAVVAIEGGFEPYGPAITAPAGASSEAAVVEAAYRTLVNYFPLQAANLGALYTEALGLIPDGAAKSAGQAVGHAAATNIITLRSGDGRMTPIGVSTPFPTLPPGPGVWRLTPPFAAPQVPWVGNVRPFILQSLDQFLPDPPPSLRSDEVGRGVQPDQGLRRCDQRRAQRRADQDREILVGERDPPVQPGRARHCRRPRAWPARDGTACGDDQRRRR
jgi:hypothetical protein